MHGSSIRHLAWRGWRESDINLTLPAPLPASLLRLLQLLLQLLL
ncbi:hypothetical protein [Streptomyces niveus]